MGILTSNHSDLQSAKEDLLLETYNKNKIFSNVHKDRLGKDIKEGDMVMYINSMYNMYDIWIGEVVGFTELRIKVRHYRRAPAPYLSVDNCQPNDVIRLEMNSIKDMFDIKNQ